MSAPVGDIVWKKNNRLWTYEAQWLYALIKKPITNEVYKCGGNRHFEEGNKNVSTTMAMPGPVMKIVSRKKKLTHLCNYGVPSSNKNLDGLALSGGGFAV